MSYITERREEEKERRRAEILDAAQSLYVERGWETVTVEQVARTARLSRALVYVYFRDKEDLLFGIGERAMAMLRERFAAVLKTNRGSGRDQVVAMGRAFMAYAFEFPHYFDFCGRFQLHATVSEATPNEDACRKAGDQVKGLVVQAIENGVKDGSIQPKLAENPQMMALSLWAFTLGVAQITMAKASDLARFDVSVPEFSNYVFGLLHTLMRAAPEG